MIRLNAAEFAAVRSPKPRRASKPKLSENDVAKAIVDYLRSLGWTCVRQQSGLFSRPGSKGRIRIGEVGAADWYAYRPLNSSINGNPCTLCEFFYFETKACGKTVSIEQSRWLNNRQDAGVLAFWMDSFEDFFFWYLIHFGRHAGDAPGFGLAPSPAGSGSGKGEV